MIDDKELARLEKLASAGYGGPFIDLTSLNNSEMRVAIPALVAEVRRLRAELGVYIDEDQTRIITLQRNIIEILREKVEAWEWYGECFDNCKQRGKLPFEMHKTPSAYSEAWATLLAAREAIC